MPHLNRLTQGLALVQQGLDQLDTQIRNDLSACNQLRKQARAQHEHTQQLKGQADEVLLAQLPPHLVLLSGDAALTVLLSTLGEDTLA